MNDFLNSAERLLMELLRLPGPSCRERQVMDFIVEKLRQAGAPEGSIRFDEANRRSPHGGEIGNLVFKLPGTRPGPRRLLMAHVDTVPLCQGARPIRQGRWIVPADRHTALGGDDRAGTAVVLSAALEILRSKQPHPPVVFFWTVQEEIGLFGARHAKLGLLGKPRLAFNFDGGPCDRVTVGATGGYHLAIRVTGRSAHAGVAPEQGVSAVTIAALAIARLHREGWLGQVKKQDRSGTSNIGVIRGGEATNVVVPLVELRGEARSHDPAFRRRIVRAIEQTFSAAAREVRNIDGKRGKVAIEGRLDYESFELPKDDLSALEAEAAIGELGGQAFRGISNGGLDANWMTARGIPTVTLGCGQMSPHNVAERIDRKEFRQGARLALRLARGGEGRNRS
jgi:tripeptide aminopeptidase